MFTTLEITFNCMAVFVPETGDRIRSVHVLFPDTAGILAKDEEHVPRLFYGNESPKALDGWALVLGGRTASTTLQPAYPGAPADLVDISKLARRKLPRAVIDDPANKSVLARVELGSGAAWRLSSEVCWEFEGVQTQMAHQLTWRIEGLLEHGPLHWVPLRGQSGSPPLTDLSQVPFDPDGVRRLHIYHMPADKITHPLPPRTAHDSDAVTRHFKALYALLGEFMPDPTILPVRCGGTGKVNCGIARASL